MNELVGSAILRGIYTKQTQNQKLSQNHNFLAITEKRELFPKKRKFGRNY